MKIPKTHGTQVNETLISGALFILYVDDQKRSAEFYSRVLCLSPTLDVPGMTEFTLSSNAKLGLMPYAGIKLLLGSGLGEPSAGERTPRSEIYLLVDHPSVFHARALRCGAIELSPPTLRDWGHVVAYSLDPDGHVLAFAAAGGP